MDVFARFEVCLRPGRKFWSSDPAHCQDHMGGCQNNGPFLGPCYNTAPSIKGTQKGTVILTATHAFSSSSQALNINAH